MPAPRPLAIPDAVASSSPHSPRLRRRPYRRAIAALTTCVVLMATVGVAGAGSDLNDDGFDDLVIGVPDENVSQSAEAGVVHVLRGSARGITAARDKLYNQANLGGSVEPGDRFGNTVAYGDFNRDGHDDVAIGSPTEDYKGKRLAGVVHVLYGTDKGVRPRDAQLISQAGKMAGSNEKGDFFGAVLASGDFDNDGYADLAIGAPGEDIGGAVAAGAVVVAYGGRNGLKTRGSQSLSQKGKVPGKAENFDNFGVSLAAGDFNNDGRDDLAIGAPGEDVGGAEDAGNVVVLFGRASGLSRAGSSFTQAGEVPGDVGAGHAFGRGLAAADFDGDGDDDLVIGASGEGRLVMLPGSSGGLSPAGSTSVSSTELPATVSPGEGFGKELAAGNFDGGNDYELAVGSQKSTVAGATEAGQVIVLGTGVAGLAASSAVGIDQGNMPKASPERDDQLGSAMRVGNFNNDGFDDLAIGAANEDFGNKRDAGVIYVVYGSGAGLQAGGAARFYQGTKGIAGKTESGDRFGAGL